MSEEIPPGTTGQIVIEPYDNPPKQGDFHFTIHTRDDGDQRNVDDGNGGTIGRKIDLLLSDPLIWPKDSQMEVVGLQGGVGIRWVKKVTTAPAPH